MRRKQSAISATALKPRLSKLGLNSGFRFAGRQRLGIIAAAVSMVSLVSIPARATEQTTPHLADQLPAGEACVGFRSSKRMLLVSEVSVVGTSCEVKIEVSEGPQNSQRLTVSIPPRSLSSGNNQRDHDVASLLGGDAGTPVIFTTDLPREASADTESLPGTLQIRGQTRPVELKLSKTDTGTVRFEVETSFPALGLKPPQVAYGLVTLVRDDLVLFGNVPAAVRAGLGLP